MPGDRRVGLLGARVFEDGEHPLDRAVHRPAHDPPARHRHRRQVLGQLTAAQQRAGAQPLDLDPRIVLAVDLVRNRIAQTVFISAPCVALPRAVGLLGRADEIAPLGEPVDPAERLAIGQGPDPLDPVEHVVRRLAGDGGVAGAKFAASHDMPRLIGLVDLRVGGRRADNRPARLRSTSGVSSELVPRRTWRYRSSCRWQISRLPTPAAVIARSRVYRGSSRW